MKSISCQSITTFLDSYLKNSTIKDSSCNGLQVQGQDVITTIGLAVDACMASYKKAVKNKCQMLIVHHGLIWDSLTTISGPTYQHIKYLIDNNLNLFASHLPLDAHPIVGNNIQLAKLLKLRSIRLFGAYHGTDIGYAGKLPSPVSIERLKDRVNTLLDTQSSYLPFGKKSISTVGIVSGGGSSCLPEAIRDGIDCVITGESAHWNHHAALEAGINVLYGGHYQTETLGVKALGKVIEKKFRVKTIFLDEPTNI
jgi:dinuclear metal center YbgI/SA1388 family protein